MPSLPAPDVWLGIIIFLLPCAAVVAAIVTWIVQAIGKHPVGYGKRLFPVTWVAAFGLAMTGMVFGLSVQEPEGQVNVVVVLTLLLLTAAGTTAVSLLRGRPKLVWPAVVVAQVVTGYLPVLLARLG
ncbi:MAG: hypothetical protein KF689_11425 [Gemmatimonadaceae bacterium]|nr:hypothetical protein [Gemmatimonadaceae bacterium]MCW5825793.1 hypothetical protein [Gemmatimonadaceae bacterium]